MSRKSNHSPFSHLLTGESLRLLSAVWIFYRKLLVPSLAFALILNLFYLELPNQYPFRSVAISYMMFALFVHFFIYEVLHPKEYNFYHNLGLSKLALWIICLIINILIASLLAILCAVCM